MSHQGIVVMYHPSKHWGFVKESDGNQWFFHLDNCAPDFQPQLGAAVEFEVGPPICLGKKDQAVGVRGVQS
jgi:cold shock CspA family protein